MGVPVQKSPSDMWNYQEIIHDLKPRLVIEFGTYFGGSAMFFSSILQQVNRLPSHVLSVDIDHSNVFPAVKENPNVELLTCSSTAPETESRISDLITVFGHPVFAILDSDHSKEHVLNEMLLMRKVLSSGDYLIVEDSNINGHPVLPFVGPGPFEAIQEYESRYPQDFRHDREREAKFGFSFAPNGFLIRN